MNRLRTIATVATGAVAAAIVALWQSFRSAPLPALPPYSGPVPAASPPADMSLTVLRTGVIHRNAGVAYRGGSLAEPRDFTMSAVLVRHPRGDLLIDAGLGRDVEAHLDLMPAAFRWVSNIERGMPLGDHLDRLGYDRSRLAGVLVTHAHWDHVSGLSDLPGVTALVPEAERGWIGEGGDLAAVARSVGGASWKTYAFDGGPYLGFARSHDVHGDGSVVVTPCPGHTPGSVIVFVTLPSNKRIAFVGDLAWQLEGITEREERPWVTRVIADHDPEGVRQCLSHVAALYAGLPELVLVPAHDPRGFAALE